MNNRDTIGFTLNVGFIPGTPRAGRTSSSFQRWRVSRVLELAVVVQPFLQWDKLIR
jgi:hypothetical protein